jgi:hypothetical protein
MPLGGRAGNQPLLARWEAIRMRSICSIYPLLLGLLGAWQLQAREWKDATGRYAVEADLLAYTDAHVVLKRQDGKLVEVEIAQLSDADRQFLNSKEATQQSSGGGLQTWTLKNGLKFVGRIVGFGRKDVVIQRKRGKVYVNDRTFTNLPEVYQRMIPPIVSHFENTEINGLEGLTQWALKLKGQPHQFTVDGVLIELENGDEYGVPFFFFSNQDLNILKPGWDRWLAAHEDAARQEQEDFRVRAQAEAYQRDRQMNQQIARMQLLLTAADAGVVDVWEVALQPGPGVMAPPQIVIVPGRSSQQAAAAALSQNPNFIVGGARRLNR